MILKLKQGTSPEKATELAKAHKAFCITEDAHWLLITGAEVKEVPSDIAPYVAQHWVFKNDLQLASSAYRTEKRSIKIGNHTIGGNGDKLLLIGGPCSVESEAQITAASQLLSKLGLSTLRGGCFKPRTSPYSFQGMGHDGLALLAQMKSTFGLQVITEARDATHIDAIIAHTDIIQVGAKAMYDQGILRAVSQIQKPVLIKRGFGTTLQEFVQAAEFVLSGGNPNVMLCERGIRTFETGTRFTLDLCGVAWLKQHTNLPIILDPSHAMGYRYGIPDLTRACVAMGIDGLLIETHPNPAQAKSDAAQQLDFDQFEKLVASIRPLAKLMGQTIV